MTSLSLTSAASRLGVSETTARRLLAQHPGSARRIGRRWYVDPAALDRIDAARQPTEMRP